MSLRDLRVQETIPIHWTGFSSTTSSSEKRRARHSDHGFASSGVSANTRVDTLRGEVAARDLQIGDMVKTKSGQHAALRWVGTSRSNQASELPMRRLNADGRESTTLLAPDHLVLVSHEMCEFLFGTDEVLCPVKHLAKAGLYVPDPSVNPVFVHMLFDTYELIQAGDDWVESLLPDMDRIRAEDLDTANDIVARIPRLSHEQGLASYIPTRPVLNEREAALLFS